jgi:uncharacterized membrane protein YbhN (UPF0104 family)
MRGISKGKILAGILDLAIIFFLSKWAYENIDAGQLASQIRRLPTEAFWVTLSLNVVVIIGYGLRLANILDTGFGKAFAVVNIGYGFNSILPLRIGDILKIYYGRAICKVPAAQLIPGSFFEKLYDLAAVFILLLLTMAFAGQAYLKINMVYALLVLIVAAGGAAFFFVKLSDRLQKAMPRLGRVREFIARVREHIVGHRFGLNLLLTAALWIVHVLVFHAAFRLFLPDVGFHFTDAMTLLLIFSLAIAIPSTPAGVGLVEAGIVAYMIQRFAVPNELALASALAFHLAVTLPHIVIATVVLGRYWVFRRR